MKKIKLEFHKEVISSLSGNELSKIRGGMTASCYGKCPTEGYACADSGNCDTWLECTMEPISKECESEKCVEPPHPPVGPVISCGCATFDCSSFGVACQVQ